MSAAINIPVMAKPNKNGPPTLIVREINKDLNINLKDWFMQILPPENGEDWTLSLQPRKEHLSRENRNHSRIPKNYNS